MLRCALLAVLSLSLIISLVQAADTDGDGFSDKLEALAGTDPASPASTPQNVTGPAVSLVKPFALLKANFSKNRGSVILGAKLDVPPGFDLNGQNVLVDIGGVVRGFALGPNGLAVDHDNVFAFVPGFEAAGRFALSLPIRDLTNVDALANVVPGAKETAITIPITIVFNNQRFTTSLDGILEAENNGHARAKLAPTGLTLPGKFIPVKNTDFTAAPLPVMPNEALTFSAASTTSDTEGILGTILLYGDGSTPLRQPGSPFTNGQTVSHTYVRPGAYTARLLTFDAGGVSLTKLFIPVGLQTAFNGDSGVASTRTNKGANVALEINVDNVENVSKVLTIFGDPLLRDTASEGTIPSRAYSSTGISVATTTVTDTDGDVAGTSRKQITIDDTDVGSSEALAAPASNQIVLSKMSGKFLFSSNDKPDQVTFTGTFTLPAGLQPGKEGGNSFAIGIGNIIDSVTVDSKGKPIDKLPSVNGYIKTLKITYPHLAKGTTAYVGGETAKISIKMSLSNMDTSGFDTEGITASLREDEQDLKTVERYIQVSMLLAGVGYESVVTVTYKVSSSSTNTTGIISGRAAR